MGARWKVWKPDPHGLASLAPLKGRATVNQHKGLSSLSYNETSLIRGGLFQDDSTL